MRFCIRDDDTNYFTSPNDLEAAYSAFYLHGPISLAVVPFQAGCNTRGVPEAYRNTSEIYPLADNRELVRYLRQQVADERIEVMLHGFSHLDYDGVPEFAVDGDFVKRVADGKQYLERLLDVKVRVFVPPHNRISYRGLQAVRTVGLHLGCMANPYVAWPKVSWRAWTQYALYLLWLKATHTNPHWIIDLGDHREIIGHAVTPTADHRINLKELQYAQRRNGVFCIATHYWEFDVPAQSSFGLTVRQQIQELVAVAQRDSGLKWSSLGKILDT